ncbi:MAG: hypothetical protein LKI25_00360 [Atopobiaceae bacterium]|nr:hypothetical protein [Atopobiaceae bacterium]MCI2206971.1 hypothetical protein [Atopobiaceae bacterium]
MTRNGYAAMVMMKPEEYRDLEKARIKQGIYDAIACSEDDISHGRVCDARDAMEQIRARYGL